eukprot:TRINITY_DN4459_c0_g1_i1.p1 TRINITY_DN4459_c0_g1~~TRINITY_DN4459_c0_g1_i1.p1  ORF type:complete len:434 (+),score=45.41 TRINITY_DN4459_c0_g1_i1:146-1447(+)
MKRLVNYITLLIFITGSYGQSQENDTVLVFSGGSEVTIPDLSIAQIAQRQSAAPLNQQTIIINVSDVVTSPTDQDEMAPIAEQSPDTFAEAAFQLLQVLLPSPSPSPAPSPGDQQFNPIPVQQLLDQQTQQQQYQEEELIEESGVVQIDAGVDTGTGVDTEEVAEEDIQMYTGAYSPQQSVTLESNTFSPQGVQYMAAANTDVPFLVQDANAPIVPYTIYDNVEFPSMTKSGQTTSSLSLPTKVQTESNNAPWQVQSSYLLDVGCKPLWMGNDCLNSLLESTAFFYSALKRTGLMDTICQFSPLTIIAPTDESFAQLAYEMGIIAEDFYLTLENQEVLRKILSLHVLVQMDLSPFLILERSSVISEQMISFLGQYLYARVDSQTSTVRFRPPISLAPSASAILTASGKDIYLQENCLVNYYYVVENVLVPSFD